MSQPEPQYKFGVRQYVAVALLLAVGALALYGPTADQRIMLGLNAALLLALLALAFWPKSFRSRRRRSFRL
jgi:hypothetical protein